MHGLEDGLRGAGGLTAAGLLRDWGGLIERAAPSSVEDAGHGGAGALRMPWQAEKAEVLRNEGLEPDAPDFGIRFARRFVEACRRGCIPRRRRRGLLRQLRGEMKWIRHAIRYLQRAGEGLAGGRDDLSPPQRAVREALALDADAKGRGLLRRLLVAHDAKPDKVAAVLELDALAVAAYRALFFDIANRRSEPFRFFATLHHATLQEAVAGGGEPGQPPLLECARLDLALAACHCGLGPRLMACDFKEPLSELRELLRYTRARWQVLLEPEGLDWNSKKLVLEMARYKQEWQQSREDDEAGVAAVLNQLAKIKSAEVPPERPDADGESCNRVLTGNRVPVAEPHPKLSTAALWRVVDQWQCVAPDIDSATVLVPPWQARVGPAAPGHDGKLPPAMRDPDFGQVFATRLAELDRIDDLPLDPPFHWIAMLAAGLQGCLPPDDAANRTGPPFDLADAQALHRDPFARRLLQAALIAVEAETTAVANALALRPGLVEAYECLFFNVIGRGDDGELRRKAERRFAADGRAPGDGGAKPVGPLSAALDEVLRVAPRLRLSHLLDLLGMDSIMPAAAEAGSGRSLAACQNALADAILICPPPAAGPRVGARAAERSALTATVMEALQAGPPDSLEDPSDFMMNHMLKEVVHLRNQTMQALDKRERERNAAADADGVSGPSGHAAPGGDGGSLESLADEPSGEGI